MRGEKCSLETTYSNSREGTETSMRQERGEKNTFSNSGNNRHLPWEGPHCWPPYNKTTTVMYRYNTTASNRTMEAGSRESSNTNNISHSTRAQTDQASTILQAGVPPSATMEVTAAETTVQAAVPEAVPDRYSTDLVSTADQVQADTTGRKEQRTTTAVVTAATTVAAHRQLAITTDVTMAIMEQMDR
jgi:hypothetical protein